MRIELLELWWGYYDDRVGGDTMSLELLGLW